MKELPNLSSGLPSPFSSITSRSSESYQSQAVGINVAREIFSFFNNAFTSSVAWISVLNFWRFRSPIFEVFMVLDMSWSFNNYGRGIFAHGLQGFLFRGVYIVAIVTI